MGFVRTLENFRSPNKLIKPDPIYIYIKAHVYQLGAVV